MYGLCTTYLSRKPPRHRGVSSLHTIKTLSYGHQKYDRSKYSCQRQQKQRLANLCRYRTDTNQYCSKTLSKRRIWHRFERNSLRARLHYNRSMPVVVSLGTIQKIQGCREDAHLIRSTRREHPLYDLDYRRESSRYQHFGQVDSRTGVVLYYGSCLYRFSTVIQPSSLFRFLCNQSKKNLQYRRIYSQPIDKSTGLRCDQIIRLTGPKSSQYYPEKIRRISFLDIDTSVRYTFLTNNFSLPALIITILYKNRWQIELFFKWIKQHLRIKKFYGYSMNAVKTQLWIAISIYVLVAILKKRLKLEASLYTILQILSLNLFEKAPLLQLLTEIDYRDINPHCDNQLTLFDL